MGSCTRQSQLSITSLFVIRDHLGTTPLANLRQTLIQDLTTIWSSLSKPAGLEKSKIQDYFDFTFVALPHKVLQPERFVEEVAKLRFRFRDGHRSGQRMGTLADDDIQGGVFLPEYHRRIPADGFPRYAETIWEQIESNKDLDLPTQQELLAQFRCDEITREVLIAFDEVISPREQDQAENARHGNAVLLPELGRLMSQARSQTLKAFETDASRYHRAVYARKRTELAAKIDARLRALYQGQLSAAHQSGVAAFREAVSAAVAAGQKQRSTDGFAEIVEQETARAVAQFERDGRQAAVDGCSWSVFDDELGRFRRDLDDVSARLRREEMRRLAVRVERWVRSRLGERVGLAFNALGSGRGGSGAPETGDRPTEQDLWDRVWATFVDVANEGQSRFSARAHQLNASPDEVDVGRWRLRRQSWTALRAKIDEEVMEGNLLMKLREQ